MAKRKSVVPKGVSFLHLKSLQRNQTLRKPIRMMYMYTRRLRSAVYKIPYKFLETSEPPMILRTALNCEIYFHDKFLEKIHRFYINS